MVDGKWLMGHGGNMTANKNSLPSSINHPPSTIPLLPRIPQANSFRIGVTSYVYPADILPNVEHLAGRVDDIELVLFESEDTANLPSPEVVARLAALGRQHRLTYTIHFPTDRKLGSADAAERAAHVAQMRRIITLLAPLPIHGYILHFEGVGPEASAARVCEWQRDLAAELPRLLEGVAPELFCVESLSYPFEWCAPLLDRFGLSVCADVGHVWRYGGDVPDFLRAWLPRTRVIHLHGERDGHDHLALTELAPGRLESCLRAARGFSGVVTLEVFDYTAARLSIERLTQCLNHARAV
jgi:sugar phosphate isomerase/epimerase